MTNKVLSIKDYRIHQVANIVDGILETLDEIESVPVSITKDEIQVILESFYQYYERKRIPYAFIECIGGHFYDMGIDAMKYDHPFNLEFVLGELQLYELLDSPLIVNPKGTKRVIRGIQKKLRR